ncbi:MAG: glycosyltransferase, partial [Kangiellaceae bacterium]|nr:glycosyltransferase [Kangiellaceae bacterium]
MIKGVSVVICTYNGRNLLKPTFEHLAKQKVTVPLEIVFVDNASTDGSKSFADQWWSNNIPDFVSYKSYDQPIAGKSYAQDLGYSKAKYEYLLVCDDDNWLSDTYIQTAYDIMDGNSSIGALGGWCEAEFEVSKPLWFDEYARYFAVSKQGAKSGDITKKKGCLYGAGMMIRKSHWVELKSNGFNHMLSCRRGNELSSGGDTEYCFALRLLGYKIWYDSRLYFKHFMTRNRLNLDYLYRLRKSMVYSNFVLIAYKDKLRNKTRNRYNFIKSGLNGFPLLYLKKVFDFIFGDEAKQREVKLYFAKLKYLFFYYA